MKSLIVATGSSDGEIAPTIKRGLPPTMMAGAQPGHAARSDIKAPAK